MTRLPTRIAMAAAVLALAGCSSTKTPAAATAPTPTPSPTPATATAIQYASAMNGEIKSFEKTFTTAQADECDMSAAGMCAIEVMTISEAADGIDITLSGLQKVGAPAYVGPPAAELKRLVVATQIDAEQVVADTKNSDHPVESWPGDASTLVRDLDAWGPYLNG